MEEKLDSVTADVENLKQVPPQRVAQPLGVGNSDMVHSTRWVQSVMSLGDASDNVAISTDVSWAERMELEEEYPLEELPQNSKVLLTEVTQPTEEFLRKVFVQIDVTRRQLRQQFIVPSTSFTTAPRLDKTIADECSKSTKTSDNTLSRIQALFLDAVGPLIGVLEGINQGKELSIEDVEGAVKAALTFLGNASSQCTSLRRIGILHNYNKDLVSYGTESDELFSLATMTLLGPMFPEKAAAHLQQMHTLRSACCSLPSKPKQGFWKAPLQYTQRWDKPYNLQRRQFPYSRGGRNHGTSTAS